MGFRLERRAGSSLGAAALLPLLALLVFAAAPASGQQRDGRQEPESRRANAVKMGTEGLVAPVKLSAELPEYTDTAKQAGIEGDVYIEAVVTKEGNVVEPELIRGLADDELNSRALEAITRWKFKPGTKDDQPVDVVALFTVAYRIH